MAQNRRGRRSVATVLGLALLTSACGGGATTPSDASTVTTIEDAPEAVSATTEPLDLVTVAALGTIDSSPMWIAEAEGLFAEEGIEVEFIAVSEADDVVNALLEGRADAIAIAPTPIIKAVAGGEDLRIVNYLNATSPDATRHSMTLITTDDRAIGDGCDLEGLRIGIDNADSLVSLAITEMILKAECEDSEADAAATDDTGDAPAEDAAAEDAPAESSTEEDDAAEPTEADLAAELAQAAARLESVEFFEASLGNQLDLLERGEVDVVGVFEPYTTQAAELGFVEIANLDQQLCPGLNRCPVGVIAMGDEWADQNADLASRFNVAINRAMLWMESRQTEYRAELVSCCGIAAEDAAGIRIPDWVGDVNALEKDLSRLIDVLESQGRLTTAPDIAEVIG